LKFFYFLFIFMMSFEKFKDCFVKSLWI